MNEERVNVALQAKAFLSTMKQSHDRELAATADDLLLFLYRLRDEYRIIQSTSDRFKGPSFAFLRELLYQLESRPDQTLVSAEWRAFVEGLLSDIATGRIVVVHR